MLGLESSVFLAKHCERGLHQNYEKWLDGLGLGLTNRPASANTTAPERTPVQDVGQGLAATKLGRRAPEAAWAAA